MPHSGWQPYPLSGPEATLKDGWFRLVDLLPGTRDAPLQCTLSSHALADAPKYEALSYAWGDATDVAKHAQMSLQGNLYGITAELEQALRQLRKEDATRTMWIDWICINQADLEERNAQVARMRDIYRTAERVVAWIGDRTEDSDRAMQFLREMAMAKKRGLRKISINGVRQGSDTSSECGNGYPEPEVRSQDFGDDETASDEFSSHEPSVDGYDPPAEVPGESSADGSSVHQVEDTASQHEPEDAENSPSDRPDGDLEPEATQGPAERPAAAEQPTEEEMEARRARTAALQEILRKEWQDYVAAREENRKRRGHHHVVGIPVLYYEYGTAYEDFFTESRLGDWEALDRLLERPWWSRTWVVQEVWLSINTILQCGNMTLKWKTLQKAMDYSEGWDDMGYYVKETPRWKSWGALKRRYGLAIHITKQRLLGCAHLSDILWNTWDREATDPRDKVFAVLGLLGDGEDKTHPPPKADYSKSVDQVYRETAAFIIKNEDSLDILLAASGLGGKEKGLPSWVPDWRRTGNDHRPALFVNASRMKPLLYFNGSADQAVFHGHGYLASGNSKVEARFSDDLKTVHVRGFSFDSIVDMGPPCGDESSVEDIIRGARSVLSRISSNGSTLLETPDGELRTILRAGSFAERQDDFSRSEDQVIKNIMSKRRFFVTKGGKLCVGPAMAEVGDSVFYIAGCNFPIVLRPQGEHLELVGEAYVHKYMAGEALEATPYGQPEWSEMAIC